MLCHWSVQDALAVSARRMRWLQIEHNPTRQMPGLRGAFDIRTHTQLDLETDHHWQRAWRRSDTKLDMHQIVTSVKLSSSSKPGRHDLGEGGIDDARTVAGPYPNPWRFFQRTSAPPAGT